MMRAKDCAGKQFGKLLVLDLVRVRNQRGSSIIYFAVRCACGVEKLVRSDHVRLGKTIGCGSCQVRVPPAPQIKHGLADHPLYQTWRSMVQRCTEPSHPQWDNYGGRGIRVCERWLGSLENFMSDMGGKPSRLHSIDRIDVNGNYEPGNCRWATWTEQGRNRRNNSRLTFRGETLTIAEWSERTGLSDTMIQARLKRWRWSIERALTEAPTPKSVSSARALSVRWSRTRGAA